MANSNWDDQKIENLLKQVPDIKDHRSKSEILAQLKKDDRLQKPRQGKGVSKWIPATVAVAALLLLSLLLPSMLSSNLSVSEENSEMTIMSDAKSDDSIMNKAEVANDAESKLYLANVIDESHILLQNELNGMIPFRIGLTYAANIIPVTFLISEEQISADFPNGNPTSLELYNLYAAEISEEDLGFDNYHPYNGELKFEDNILIHKVLEGHGFDGSAANLGVYYHSINETFIDYKQFKTVDETGQLAEFDHVGMTEIINLNTGKRPLPYYKYKMPSGQFYLIPDGGEGFDTVEEALHAMKVAPNDMVEVLIPENVNYDIRVIDGGGVAVLSFKETLDLHEMEYADALAMIEGFMLTAQNYQMVAKLENVEQQEFGKYNLTGNLPNPAAVNPIYFNQD